MWFHGQYHNQYELDYQMTLPNNQPIRHTSYDCSFDTLAREAPALPTLNREDYGYHTQSFIPYAECFITKASRLLQGRNFVNPPVESTKHFY